jgi:hypothetical protein
MTGFGQANRRLWVEANVKTQAHHFSGVDFSHVDAISGDLAQRISLLAILRGERNEF